jgi:hypothetical protein
MTDSESVVKVMLSDPKKDPKTVAPAMLNAL